MTVRARTVFAAALWCSCLFSTAAAQFISNPDSLFFEALRLQHAGHLESAELKFRVLLNAYPEYHDARVQYGRIRAWEGRFDEAVQQFDSVLFMSPGHTEARFAKAQTLGWSGRYRQSANILLALLEENTKAARILNELGTVYLRGGAPRRALDYYEKAYFQSPGDNEIMRGLARTHRRLGNQDLALYWYKKLLALSPGDAEARDESLRLMYDSDHEIQISGSYESYRNPGIDEHTNIQAEYYLTLNEHWKPFVHGSRISKFGTRDTRYGAGVYGIFDHAFGMFAQLKASPRAGVAPDFDATLELDAGVSSSVELIAGYRFMRFDTIKVNVGMPGLTWYIQDNAWLTMRTYFAWVPALPVSSAGTVTMTMRVTAFSTFRFGGFTGNELFQATSINEVSALKSSGGFLGIKSRLNAELAVEAIYQYTSRNLLADSHLLTLSVSTFF